MSVSTSTVANYRNYLIESENIWNEHSKTMEYHRGRKEGIEHALHMFEVLFNVAAQLGITAA